MTRFALIGGFLGAGKTTLIGQIARQYTDAGKSVGIITNDQAADLVDTHHLRSKGFSVGEVAGACFCCSFDDLVATADSLGSQAAPDLLIAEPVGSCTDLVATVILPLQQLLGEKFELAPFGVLLKPSHGQRILSVAGTTKTRSGFSPQAEYIFRKQLEEADYLMIGRSDQLSDQQQQDLTAALQHLAPEVPVLAVSPKTGRGVDQVIGFIESPMVAGRRLLEIDYDTYADGEAELGWVNLAANLTANNVVDLDTLAADTVRAVASQIHSVGEGAIAHIKASVLGGETQAVANVVNNDGEIDIGLLANRQLGGQLQIILNARVAMDPTVLQSYCESSIKALADRHDLAIDHLSARSLRPGRPEPTHRVTASSNG